MTTYVDLEDVRMCTRTPYLWGYSWGGLPFSPHPIEHPSEAWHVTRQSIWWM